jgi:hypothetical protein
VSDYIGKHAKVEADPKKPYKAIAAFAAPAVVAFANYVISKATHDHWPTWLIVLIGGIAAAAATFVVKNPLRMVTGEWTGPGRRRTQDGVLSPEFRFIILLVVVVVVVVIVGTAVASWVHG